MREAVSDVLVARMREADGLNRMILVSLGAHILLLAIVVLMPASWRTAEPRAESEPMVISLTGALGPPESGGRVQMSERPVQEAAPESVPRRFEPPPMAKPPEMLAPAPPRPAPKPPPKPVNKPVERSASRRPTTGPEVRSGAANAETGGSPIPFGGLSRSGGAQGTGAVLADAGNFCCPDYILALTRRVHEVWNQRQGVAGMTVVKFTIARDGAISNVTIDKSSGNPILDMESRRAVLGIQRLSPLPRQYTADTLTVYLQFEYRR